MRSLSVQTEDVGSKHDAATSMIESVHRSSRKTHPSAEVSDDKDLGQAWQNGRGGGDGEKGEMRNWRFGEGAAVAAGEACIVGVPVGMLAPAATKKICGDWTRGEWSQTLRFGDKEALAASQACIVGVFLRRSARKAETGKRVGGWNFVDESEVAAPEAYIVGVGVGRSAREAEMWIVEIQRIEMWRLETRRQSGARGG